MKAIINSIFLLLSFSLFSQEKGVAPINNHPETSSGQTYAVVVGISDYQDEGIPDLRFADKDALAFAGFLQSPAGGSLDENHLILLTNEQATIAQLVAALDWLLEQAKEGDQAIIYFSGHGDVEIKTRSQLGFLLTWDSPGRSYMAGAYPVFYLQNIVETLSLDNKSKVLLITDACRSGKLAGNVIGGSQLTSQNLANQFANEIKILSCQPDEYSIEGEQWGGGRGAFSFHLIDGLYGLADRNDDQFVSLLEVGRYLEDHVTEEVAPHNQLPMTVGNGRENLVIVIPEILVQIKEDKKRQLQQFKPTASRGIEEEILAEVDTSIQEIYQLFQQSLVDKDFLVPMSACADLYYKQLMNEPTLERLHSSMTRNYAVALQDDAQQVLNNWLTGDVEESNISKVNKADKYKHYPAYLDRAGELLGSNHYMYPVLQSRKLYFEGYLMHIDLQVADKDLGKKILKKYRAALKLQPESPHIYNSMQRVYFYQMQQADSAEYYAQRATEIAPFWVAPYSGLSFMYSQRTKLRNLDKALKFLDLADEIDSTAAYNNVWHINNRAIYYLKSLQLKKAEEEYKKAIAHDSTVVAIYNNLGGVYLRLKKFKEAEKYIKKAIELDSTSQVPYLNLAQVYFFSRQYTEAETQYKKALSLDSTLQNAISGLAGLYIVTKRIEEGEALFQKYIEMDSTALRGYMEIGAAYMMIQRPAEAEKVLQKLLSIDSLYTDAIGYLVNIYAFTGRQEEAEQLFLKILNIGLDLAMEGQYEEGKEILQKSMKLFSANKKYVYLNYAILYSLQGQLDNAFEQIELAFKNGLEYEDEFLNKKNDQGLSKMRQQEGPWNSLLQIYFPEQHKN